MGLGGRMGLRRAGWGWAGVAMGYQGPKVRSAVAVTVSQSSARSRP